MSHFNVLWDGAEVPPSGSPAPAPNTYEITAIPAPTPDPDFPLSMQWQSDGVDLGEPNVRVINFIAALDEFLVTRGTGEQSNVITVRKLTAPPPPPPATEFQFWRLLDWVIGAPDTSFETREIQLLDGATVRTQGLPSSSITESRINQQLLSMDLLCDGDWGPNPFYFQWDFAIPDPTLILTFNLGAPYSIDGCRISRVGNVFGPRFPESCVLQYSADGSSWTTVGTGYPVRPPPGDLSDVFGFS